MIHQKFFLFIADKEIALGNISMLTPSKLQAEALLQDVSVKGFPVKLIRKDEFAAGISREVIAFEGNITAVRKIPVQDSVVYSILEAVHPVHYTLENTMLEVVKTSDINSISAEAIVNNVKGNLIVPDAKYIFSEFLNGKSSDNFSGVNIARRFVESVMHYDAVAIRKDIDRLKYYNRTDELQQVAPAGATTTDGAAVKTVLDVYKEMVKPLKVVPTSINVVDKTITIARANFGSSRKEGRKHAGLDLYVPEGTTVYAMEDGTIFERIVVSDNNKEGFNGQTDAIAIKGSALTIRYCELTLNPKLGGINSRVKKGELLGTVKKCKGVATPMLHLEMYRNPNLEEALTQKTSDSPYKRRGDITDPKEIIMELYAKV